VWGCGAGAVPRPIERCGLGWHTDATEERKYIIAGTGKLYLEDGSTWPVGPGSVFVLPTPSVAVLGFARAVGDRKVLFGRLT
jgi:uncharacterized cupin superfamily protein